MGRPEDDPIGARPTLPRPGGDAADRGTQLFRQLLKMGREGGVGGASAWPGPVESKSPAEPTVPVDVAAVAYDTGARRYDVALAVIAEAVRAPAAEAEHYGDALPYVEAEPLPDVLDDEPTVAPDAVPHRAVDPTVPPRESEEGMQAAPRRPPPGVPTVRPSAPAARPVDVVPQDILETAADTAMLTSDERGHTSFDISFRDELFEDLTCRITVEDGRVVAYFRVADANTRRLLEAEAGRLRANLEQRGLRVAEIRVDSG